MVHVPEAAGAGLDVLDDAVESLEDRVGAPIVEVGEDVLPVPAELSGEGLHRFQPRMHHPRAQCLGPGLRLRAAGTVGVDVLQAFAHPTRLGGLRPLFRQIAPDLQLRVREVGLVPRPQALRAFEQRTLPGLGLARHHADHVALRQVGDDGDAPVAPAAGLVDADRLHARVVLVQARLLHVMADEPPRSRVVPADRFGDVRDRLAFRRFHDHRPEQERGRRRPDAPTAPSQSSRRAPGTPPVARRRG